MVDFGLKTPEQKEIERYFQEILEPNQEIQIWIFGSRARGEHRTYSDVDLLLEAHPELKSTQIAAIKEKLEESNLPYLFDLVLEPDLFEPYKNQILQEKKPFLTLKNSSER